MFKLKQAFVHRVAGVTAVAIMLAAAIQPAQAVRLTDRYASAQEGKYVWLNNTWTSSWGWGMAVETFGGSNNWSLEWSFPNTTGNSIEAYPEVYMGLSSYNNYTSGSGLPVQVKANRSIHSQWYYNWIWNPTGGGNCSYDLAFYSDPKGGTIGQPDAELMIWFNSWGGSAPAGSIIAENASFWGANWRVKSGTISNSGKSWTVVSYQRNQTTNGQWLDINSFVQDARNRGLLSQDLYLARVSVGCEVAKGSGKIRTTSYYCDVK